MISYKDFPLISGRLKSSVTVLNHDHFLYKWFLETFSKPRHSLLHPHLNYPSLEKRFIQIKQRSSPFEQNLLTKGNTVDAISLHSHNHSIWKSYATKCSQYLNPTWQQLYICYTVSSSSSSIIKGSAASSRFFNPKIRMRENAAYSDSSKSTYSWIVV